MIKRILAAIFAIVCLLWVIILFHHLFAKNFEAYIKTPAGITNFYLGETIPLTLVLNNNNKSTPISYIKLVFHPDTLDFFEILSITPKPVLPEGNLSGEKIVKFKEKIILKMNSPVEIRLLIKPRRVGIASFKLKVHGLAQPLVRWCYPEPVESDLLTINPAK